MLGGCFVVPIVIGSSETNLLMVGDRVMISTLLRLFYFILSFLHCQKKKQKSLGQDCSPTCSSLNCEMKRTAAAPHGSFAKNSPLDFFLCSFLFFIDKKRNKKI